MTDWPDLSRGQWQMYALCYDYAPVINAYFEKHGHRPEWLVIGMLSFLKLRIQQGQAGPEPEVIVRKDRIKVTFHDFADGLVYLGPISDSGHD